MNALCKLKKTIFTAGWVLWMGGLSALADITLLDFARSNRSEQASKTVTFEGRPWMIYDLERSLDLVTWSNIERAAFSPATLFDDEEIPPFVWRREEVEEPPKGFYRISQPSAVPDEVLVRYWPTANFEIINTLLPGAGVVQLKSRHVMPADLAVGLTPLYIYAITNSPDQAADLIALIPGVRLVQPNYIGEALSSDPEDQDPPINGGEQIPRPTDPFNVLGASWGYDAVNAPFAYAITANNTAASDVVVAILDTGVNISHQDIAPSLWRNPKESPGPLDFDGNGWAGDVHGVNTFKANTVIDDVADNYHGTAIASILAAPADGIGMVGVAPRAKILPVVIANNRQYSDAALSLAISYIIDAKWRHDLNLPVAVIAYHTGERSPLLEEDFARAANAGIILVCSATHKGQKNRYLSYPARYNTIDCSRCGTNKMQVPQPPFNAVISVAELRKDGGVRNTNVLGLGVHVLAPGDELWAAGSGINGYKKVQGSSFAAPYIAGAVALMAAHRPMPPELMRAHLLTHVNTSTVYNGVQYRGVLDVEKIMTAPVTTNYPPRVPSRILTIPLDATNGYKVGFDPLTGAYDPEGHNMFLESWTQPGQIDQNVHGDITRVNELLVYTLREKPIYTTYEAFKFQIVDDMGARNDSLVTIQIQGANNPPRARNDYADYPYRSPTVAINVLANDVDYEGGSLVISSFSPPSSGVLTGIPHESGVGYASLTLVASNHEIGDQITGSYTVSDGTDEATAVWRAVVVDPVVYDAPTLVNPNRSFDITNANLTIVWTSVSFAQDYEIVLTRVPDGVEVLRAITTNTFIAAPLLQMGEQYRIELRGRRNEIAGPKLLFTFWTISPINRAQLISPTNNTIVKLHMIPPSSNKLVFSWHPVSNAASYTLLLQASGISYSYNVTNTSYQIAYTNLQSMADYQWWVRVNASNKLTSISLSNRFTTASATQPRFLRYRFANATAIFDLTVPDLTNRFRRGLRVASPQTNITSRLFIDLGYAPVNQIVRDATWTWYSPPTTVTGNYYALHSRTSRFVTSVLKLDPGVQDVQTRYNNMYGRTEWISPPLRLHIGPTTSSVTNREVVANLLIAANEVRRYSLAVPQLQDRLTITAGPSFMADVVPGASNKYRMYVGQGFAPTTGNYTYVRNANASGTATLTVTNAGAGEYVVRIINNDRTNGIFFGDLSMRYDPYTPSVLTNRQFTACLSLPNNGERWFYLSVPKEKPELLVETFTCQTTTGLTHIYVHRGSMPTNMNQFTWSRTGTNVEKSLTINNPQEGIYYIMLRGEGGNPFSGIRLKAIYDP